MAGCCELAEDSPWKIWNVKIFNLMILSLVLIMTIATGSTFDAYLLELAKSKGETENYANTFVGTVESVNGLVSLALAVPLGWLADKVNKRRMLQGFMVPATLGVVAMIVGILGDIVPLIYVGTVLQSLHGQVYMSCGAPFLADCVPKHQLQSVVTSNGAMFATASGVGPLLQILLIQFMGDSWDLKKLHVFCVSGYVLWPAAVVLTCMLVPSNTELQSSALTERLADEAARPNGEVAAEAAPTTEAPAATVTPAAAEDPMDIWKEEKVFGYKKKWVAPIIVEFCSLVTSVGAGMTVKFFPLFFKEDYHFSPTAFCMLTVTYSFAIGFFVKLFSGLGGKIGTIRAAVLCHFLGTMCLLAMWRIEAVVPLVLVFILRGGIMNAKGPIDSGIVMVCIESKYRGRWSALQTVSRVSWAGSAFLGGWLADSHDYRYTFLITGLIYITSWVCYLPLLWVMPADFGKTKKVAPEISS